MVAAYNQMNHYGRANGMAPDGARARPGRIPHDRIARAPFLAQHLPRRRAGRPDGLPPLGAAALSLAFTQMELVSTVEFKMNYLHAVHLHDVLVAKGAVDHTGNTLVVSSCVIYRIQDGQPDVAVARGLGTFNRYPATKRDFAQLVMPE